MALATASGAQMVDMNVTPLVDVMLVLLIIFMVTMPAVSYPLILDLSRTPPPEQKVISPDPLILRIDAAGTMSLDGRPIGMEELKARFELEAARGIVGNRIEPLRQPALQLRVDPQADYDQLAKVLSRAKNANLMRIGFAD